MIDLNVMDERLMSISLNMLENQTCPSFCVKYRPSMADIDVLISIFRSYI